MKDTFRQSMKWLHTWVGLSVGWLLFFVFVTGSSGYFVQEITRWMEPERPLAAPHISKEKMLHLSQFYLAEHASGAQRWIIRLPSSRNGNLQVGWNEAAKAGQEQGKWVSKVLDAETGAESAAIRATGGGGALYSMHYRLHYVPRIVGYWIVGFCTMLLLLAVITGVIFHKKIFSDFFTFRAKKGLIGWLDIHNVLSVIALPFHFMITYSGLIFFLTTYMALSFDLSLSETKQDEFYQQVFPDTIAVEKSGVAHTLAPLTDMYSQTKKYWSDDTLTKVVIEYPNDINARVNFYRWQTDISYNAADNLFFTSAGKIITIPEREFIISGRIHEGFISLHEGRFSGKISRWIYFLLGLIGAAMIASGSILWTNKRKAKQEKQLNGPDFGYRLVEQLNIGTFVGLPIAIAVYFCANRLLPVGMENRAEWEMHCLFISWGLLLTYPLFRAAGKAALRATCQPLLKQTYKPPLSAWLGQLKLAAFIFGFIPLLNFITTDKHLGVTLLGVNWSQVDWGYVDWSHVDWGYVDWNYVDWNYAGFDLTMLVIGLSFAFTAYKVKQRLLMQAGAINNLSKSTS